MASERIQSAEVGSRLRTAREAHGITQAKAADHVGITRTTLVAIEQGKRRIQATELSRLARLYGTSANALLREEAVHVDLLPRFRSFPGKTRQPTEEAARILNDLVRTEVELENLLGIERTRNLPPERPLMPGDVRIQAENDAIELRQRLGLGSAPVRDLVSLLELELGIRVYIRPLDSSVSGLFAYDDHVGGCMLFNVKHPPERRTFTAAHELGHLVSSRRKPDVFGPEEFDASREERYANIFARAFLTPMRTVTDLFRKITMGADVLTRRHIIFLAYRFGVSREAMVRRLEEIGIVKRGAWDWFKANDGITDEQARQVLGDRAFADLDAKLVTEFRLHSLAAEAWRKDLLSEGQLARLLRVDRIGLREILDDADAEKDETNGMLRVVR